MDAILRAFVAVARGRPAGAAETASLHLSTRSGINLLQHPLILASVHSQPVTLACAGTEASTTCGTFALRLSKISRYAT